MTDGSPIRLMIRFSLPLLLINVLQLVFVVVDSAILGRLLGVNAFASVGVTGSIHWMGLSSIFGIVHGFSVQFAQRFGAKDEEGLRKSFATGLILALLLSAVIIITGVFGARPVLRLLDTPRNLIDGAAVYLIVFFAGAPVVFAYNILGGMLRSLGDSRTPLNAMILATVLNIGFDFALVVPFGIAGVSAATILAQGTASVYCFIVLKKTGYLRGDGFRWDGGAAAGLLKLGLPLAIRNAVIEIGGFVVQRHTNTYGEEFIAGIAAAKRMYSLLLVAGGAVEAAVATFVAQNFGAGLKERVRRGVYDGLKMMLVSTAAIMAISLPFGRQILALLVEGDPVQIALVLDAGVQQLTVYSIGLPLLCLLFLYRSALQGIGNTFIPMLSGIFEFLLRIVTVVTLTPIWDKWGVYLSDAFGWVAATSLLVISYYIVFKRLYAQSP